MRTEGVPLRRGPCVRKKLRSPQGVDSPAAPGARGCLRYRHLRLCRDEQPIRSLPASLSDSARDGTSWLEEPALENSIEHISPAEAARPDAWLCELTLHEGASELPDVAPLPEQVATRVVAANDGEAKACPCSTRPKLAARASDRGYLPIELEKYLSLLDWTGRELRAESRGAIPDAEKVSGTKNPFLVPDTFSGCGRRWFQGQCAAKIAFQ